MLRVYGASLSLFVRKVLLTLEYKEIPFEQVVVGPGAFPPNWRDISPLGKMPVLEHDGFTVPDSSVICRYLEEVFPARPIFPAEARARATAGWFEEYGDSRLTEAVAPFFFERVVKPLLLKQQADENRLATLDRDTIPAVLDYLDKAVPPSGFLSGQMLSIADFGIVSPFIAAKGAGFAPDPAKFKKLTAYLARVGGTPVVARRIEREAVEMAALRR